MKSYFFYSQLNKNDFDLLKQRAIEIRNEKNKISRYISSHRDVLEGIYNGTISKYDLGKEVKHLRTINDAVAYQQLVADVYTKYSSLFSNLTYKSKEKTNLKEKNFILKYRIITKEKFLELINKHLKKNTNDELIQKVIDLMNKTNIFEDVQEYIQKYLDFRQKKPIQFQSLTFSSINVLQKNISMLFEQHEKHTNCCFILNLPKLSKINIKTRWNKYYHGNIKDFSIKPQGNQIRLNYQIKFLDNKKIKLILTKENNEQQKIINAKNIMGIDVNTKHNLFCFSDGHTIRYDNKLIYKEKGLRKYLSKMAHYKAIHHNKERNKKVKLREEKQTRRRKFHQDLKASLAIKYAKQHSIDHIVMEDIQLKELKGVKLKKNKNLKGMNYNHVKVAIHISDMKNSVQRLCIREGIQFSLVNARYTSRTCPVCGHIHDDNRKTQEDFKCVKCGFSMNADHVAALNIALRMHVQQLQDKLQYFDTTNQMYKGKGYKGIEKFQNIYEEVYNDSIAMNVINTFIVRNNMGKAC